jgi:tetrathionate reductase subunit C
MSTKSITFKFWIFLLLVGCVIGLASAYNVFTVGLSVTNMNDRVPWGFWEAVYIFLTGLSAGSFIISSLGLFGIEKFKPISRIAIIQAIVLLVIAPTFLLLSLGNPLRFYKIYFVIMNPTSVISWGAWLLLIYPVICIIYAFYTMRRDMVKIPLSDKQLAADNRKATFFGKLGVPAAVMVHGYTGVLLGLVAGRPLWNTALMPVLFLTSAIVSGMALLIIISHVMEKFSLIRFEKNLIPDLAGIMLGVLIIDLFFIACEVLTGVYNHGSEHYDAMMVLIVGKYAWSFIGIEIILGAILPALLLAWSRSTAAILTSASLIVLGVLAMRWNFILGGQVIPIYGGAKGEYIPSLIEYLYVIGTFAYAGLLYTIAVLCLPLSSKIKKEETING